MRNAWTLFNPFAGVAESVTSSNVIDLRDAFDFSVSWYTTSGTTTDIDWQVSNYSMKDSIPEAAWSTWTSLVVSEASFLQPPLGVAFGRLVRTASGASVTFKTYKQIR